MKQSHQKNALKSLKKNQLTTLCQHEQLVTTGVGKGLFTRLVKQLRFDADKYEEKESYCAAEMVKFLWMDEQPLREMGREKFETEEHLLRLGKSRKFPGGFNLLTRQCDQSKLKNTSRDVCRSRPRNFTHRQSRRKRRQLITLWRSSFRPPASQVD